MSLNIKNEETYTLVKQLVGITGESQTTAVTVAVQERLNRLRQRKRVGLSERLLAIGRDTAPRFKEPLKSTEIGNLLYDEDGLPESRPL